VADPAAVRRLVDEVIAEYDDRSLTGSLPQLVDLRLEQRTGPDCYRGVEAW
jgi:pilus assembly protein CpaF